MYLVFALCSCTGQVFSDEMHSFFARLGACCNLERLNLSVLSDHWDVFCSSFRRYVCAPKLKVLMLGLENFEVMATDEFVTHLLELIPSSVEILFLRFYRTCPEGVLGLLQSRIHARGCTMWVFVDESETVWYSEDIDIFAPCLSKCKWTHPSQLAHSLCWDDVLRRRQRGTGWPLPPLNFIGSCTN